MKDEGLAEDRKFMRRAIELAKKGEGFTSPNPMVGAVIVKNGRIIGEGYHERYGGLHAERNALASVTESPKGAVIYVTLEPCCHYGKQPPCVDAILEAGIARVVTGSDDPNPLVAGKGFKKLIEHGVEVTTHVEKEACDALNPVFFHYIQTGIPYVAMKYAMTMDGKIAAYTGQSKWITGEEARAFVQKLRHRYTGIMAGAGTVLADDPRLTCRIPGARQPVRIICDTRLRIPSDANVVETAKEIPTILATCQADPDRIRPFEEKGCQVLTLPEEDGHVDLRALMRELGKRQIDSILLEGGGTLNWSALKSGIVQKVYCFTAPKLFGGSRCGDTRGRPGRGVAGGGFFSDTSQGNTGGRRPADRRGGGYGCLQELLKNWGRSGRYKKDGAPPSWRSRRARCWKGPG